MNNRGFGLRDEIVVGIIMFILLLFVTVQIKNMYSDLNSSTSNGNVVETPQEEPPKENDNIDVYYYYDLEDKVKTASYLYLNDRDIDLNNKVFVITSDMLIENGYLTELVDEDNNKCTSNSLVSKDKYDFTIIDVFVKCNKYTTDEHKGE